MKQFVVVVAVLCAACGSKKDDSKADKADKGDKGEKSDKAHGGATEATLQLNKLQKNAKVYFVTNAAYPIGKAGPMPDKPCCSYPDKKCPVTKDWAANKVWADLDFQIDEPNQFQYLYDSADGKTATITATGSPDCSGDKTWVLELETEAGNPTFKLTEP